MASNTAATWNKRDRRHGNMGKRRKAAESKRSTPSYKDLFAACGEPGKALAAAKKPAPKAASAPARSAK
jgi:hypothetical protein